MLHHTARASLLAIILFTSSACTQPPAQVELKGQNTYDRNASNGLASSAPVSSGSSTNIYQTTASSSNYTGVAANAKVDSIGVSDLAAPTKTASSPAPAAHVAVAPFQPARPDAASVNPWTSKPRSAEASAALDQSFNIRPQGKPAGAVKEQMVSEIKAAPQKGAVLDTIVDNEGSLAKKPAATIVNKMAKADAAPAAVSSFMWPVNSKKVISEFGPKGKGKANDGINIASADGEPVWAAADGEVVYVGNELQGYGNMVLIKHNGNKATSYAHLSRATVDKYDRVKQGDIIGYVGTSGNVKEPQLHFAIRDGKDPVDPLKYMKSNVASLK